MYIVRNMDGYFKGEERTEKLELCKQLYPQPLCQGFLQDAGEAQSCLGSLSVHPLGDADRPSYRASFQELTLSIFLFDDDRNASTTLTGQAFRLLPGL
jgi:hypothetical protein